ncbi:hypothetical protein CAPTEDRAFT_193750 [Capitella teleta]|uniref:Uncharacterized protein n=1 Tax=Capitella teleta TaxID=283909 RepID=R7VG56_CAPTE|nr:hypothetical protein CAPTEDRAFT_193750 [Capitella teleta]|eukprot:ELU15276.1 hypothetical protein CAPTEDRAFT_193750 [Capitella teleta]
MWSHVIAINILFNSAFNSLAFIIYDRHDFRSTTIKYKDFYTSMGFHVFQGLGFQITKSQLTREPAISNLSHAVALWDMCNSIGDEIDISTSRSSSLGKTEPIQPPGIICGMLFFFPPCFCSTKWGINSFGDCDQILAPIWASRR